MFSPLLEKCVCQVAGAARAGEALLGVDHQVGDQPGASERGEAEQRRRRVAARGRHEVRGGDRLAVKLRQPVGGVFEQLRVWMRAVPLFVGGEL